MSQVHQSRSIFLSLAKRTYHAQVDPAGFAAALGAANRLNEGVSLASAWGFETILTCLLVFTVLAATDAQRATKTSHLPVGHFSLHEKYAAHV